MDGENFEEDEIHSVYTAAANLSQKPKTMMPILKYDPFLLWTQGFDKKKIALYAKQVEMQRARLTLFITATIAIDSLVRHGMQNVDMAKYNLCDPLVEIGKRIELILDMKDGTDGERNGVAHLLLAENLVRIRTLGEISSLPTEDDTFYVERIKSQLKEEHPGSIQFSSEADLHFFLGFEYVIVRLIVLLLPR